MSPKRTHRVEFNIDEAKATAIGEILLDQFYNKQGFFKGCARVCLVVGVFGL